MTVEKRPIRTAVSGACGKMGREVVKAVAADPALQLVAAVDRQYIGQDMGGLVGLEKPMGVSVQADLQQALEASGAQVCVDFTRPDSALPNALTIIRAGCRPVIGTTGLSAGDLLEIQNALKEKELGGMAVANFAIGAVLMMKFAREASKYLDHAEIIELHHNRKADAPSGTALKTAEGMASIQPFFGSGNLPEHESLAGARGALASGNIRIHSVRLPGLVAHQEILFGGEGQLLTLRHDSLDRTSFMPGVRLAVKKVMELTGLVEGLEAIL